MAALRHLVLAVCGIGSLVGRLSAQANRREPRTTWLFEAQAAAYTSPYRHEGAGGFGFAVGIERRFGAGGSLRIVGRRLRTSVISDDLSVCPPPPYGGCSPSSVFAGTISMADVLGVIRPVTQVPLLLFAGGGVVLPSGEAVDDGARPDTELNCRTRIAWQAGVELSLGNSRRAPRLYISRSVLPQKAMSLDGMVTVALQVRPK